MADRYPDFQALAAAERRGIDYRVCVRDRGSRLVVLAPHGGLIEPGTSEIAGAIAGKDHSFYAFEGLRPGRPHGDLHITSTRFDEPEALRLVGAAETALAIHGCKDDGPAVWLGGRGIALRDAVAASLDGAGFEVRLAERKFAGRDLDNICNKGRAQAGVQLEIPRTLRDQLVCEFARLRIFSGAIREAIAPLRGR